MFSIFQLDLSPVFNAIDNLMFPTTLQQANCLQDSHGCTSEFNPRSHSFLPVPSPPLACCGLFLITVIWMIFRYSLKSMNQSFHIEIPSLNIMIKYSSKNQENLLVFLEWHINFEKWSKTLSSLSFSWKSFKKNQSHPFLSWSGNNYSCFLLIPTWLLQFLIHSPQQNRF